MWKKMILGLTLCMILLCAGFGERKDVVVSIPFISEGNTGTYIYEMVNGNQVVDTVTVSHELERIHQGSFSVSCSEPGTYHYQIREQGKTSVYEVSVHVAADEAGNLFGEPILYRAGESVKLDACSFVQTAADSTDASEPPGAAIPDEDVPLGSIFTGDLVSLFPFVMLFAGSGILLLILFIKRGRD